ncbi:MAG: VWA domain-containing protein [Planctomycetes bacterium]|nr:VWA domain-containing protein [Planctomycetota bacterium]
MITRKSWMLLGLLALLGGSLAAQGIVVDRRIDPDMERPRHRPAPRTMPIDVRSHQVETTIDNQGATTKITQVFYNPNNWQLEGEYLFPLPLEAAINEFQMTMNGTMVKGELLPADKARQIYEDTVRRMIDPGLLEYAGRGLFKARVFPILPCQELTITFTYTELLPYDSGLVRFIYPLRTQGYSPNAPKNTSVKVNLKSEQALRTIYSPTHSVEVIRKGDKEAVIGFEMKDAQAATDFELFYGFAEGAMAANVLGYREGTEAGYFLALLTPKIKLEESDILPKDVIVVLDTSGSMMDDGKIDQARKALKFCISKLNEKDRFAIVTFSTEARKLHDALTDASKEAREAALAKVDKIDATGGTNFESALRMAYELAGKESTRPCYILLMSDGLPTMGEITDVRGLAKLAKENRSNHVRIFPFGVGYDVNTWLLDTLAEENKGQREYVKPKEDMEVKVSNFANKIASPVLSDVKMRIDGAEIHDLHPQVPGDVFAGTQLSVLGRFDKPGKHQLILEGTVNGTKRAYEYTIEFKESDNAKAYLPRMWAVRRVGYLMDQINLKGQNKEVVEEIVRLGTKFGIVTPYTSFLVVEDTPPPRAGQPMPENRPRGGRAVGGDDSGDGAGSGARAPAPPQDQTGKDAVERSKSNAERRDSDNAQDGKAAEGEEANAAAKRARDSGYSSRADKRKEELKKKGMDDEQAAKESSNIVKTIGTRSFVWSDGIWLESDLTNGELFGAETVEYMSEDWFALARGNDNVSKILALGNEVVLRVGKKTIRVVDKSAQAEDKSGEKNDEKKGG